MASRSSGSDCARARACAYATAPIVARAPGRGAQKDNRGRRGRRRVEAGGESGEGRRVYTRRGSPPAGQAVKEAQASLTCKPFESLYASDFHSNFHPVYLHDLIHVSEAVSIVEVHVSHCQYIVAVRINLKAVCELGWYRVAGEVGI